VNESQGSQSNTLREKKGAASGSAGRGVERKVGGQTVRSEV
jgi:hypothetical protein